MSLEAFQAWVIQTGLVVSLLIVIILLIRRPFARVFGANAAYALWSLPLIRLCLPDVSISQNWIPGFLRQAPIRAESPSVLEFPAKSVPAVLENSEFIAPMEVLSPIIIDWSVIAIAVWVSVAVLWFGYQLQQQASFVSIIKTESAAPSSELLEEVELAAHKVGLRKTPSVLIANDASGPLVTNVFHPLVILPNRFDQIYDAQQRHFALVHEFAHIKRGDLWVALATLIFRAVNWPNPLVHYASHKLRGDQEAACDAFVVRVTGGKTTHSYAETLVKAVRQKNGLSRRSANLALSLSETDPKISKGD